MTPTSETRALTARLADLLSRERGCLADFLVTLADFDRERRWRELGYASLFDFLHRELRLSRGATFYRKSAAELLQRFPEIVEPLRDGRLCFTSILEVAKGITVENRAEVLPRFFNTSKKEAQAIAAEVNPVKAPPQRVVVTALPAQAPRPLALALRRVERSKPSSVACAAATESHPVHPDEPTRPGSAATPQEVSVPSTTPRDEVVPLTADLRRLHATVSRQFLRKLEAARAALSHSNPGASVQDVLEAGLDLILAKDAKKKALVAKPRPPGDEPPADPTRFPATEKRAVWKRDGLSCQWKLEGGGLCGSTYQLELDHRVGKAKGGKGKASNGRILCRFHNDLAAREAYGDAHMDRFTRRARPAPQAPQQDGLPGT
jgi:hypothetical protein